MSDNVSSTTQQSQGTESLVQGQAADDLAEEEQEEEEEIPDSEREVCDEPVEDLLVKNTESFTCLAQYILSRSSLLRNPLYHFPPLEDPGIDAAFNLQVPEEQIDYVGIDRYKSLCKDAGIMVLSRVVKSLETPSLNLRYYGLTPKQLKAIFKSLNYNVYVKELNLEENYIDADSANYLCDMLRENDTIQVLNMKECRIGPEGAKNLSDGVLTTQTLTDLDLSCNNLGAGGIKNLKDALKDNCTIKRLNLSKNDLGDDCIADLAVILSDNFAVTDLDLSWNRINSAAAWKQLANEGLIPNKDLQKLNLSWNAFCLKPAMRSLMKYTKESETLEYLDLSNNMIGGELARMIKGLIMKSPSLLGLNIGFNPLTPDDAQNLIEVLLLPKNTRPPLEELNMDNVFVKKDFLGFLRRATRLNKKVTIGGVLGNWTIKGPDIPKLLFERCRFLSMKPKKKKLRKDFGWFIFTLPDKPMSQSDFTDLVKKSKMKTVDKDVVNSLMKAFKFKRMGVDAGNMKKAYLEMYPDAQPEPKKHKKGRKKKKKKKGAATESEGEEAGEEESEEWGQGPEILFEEEEAETVEGESDEEEEVEEDEEEEEEGEGVRRVPVEVAKGESVTDVIAQLGDDQKGKDPKALKTVGSGGFAHLEPISEVSEA